MRKSSMPACLAILGVLGLPCPVMAQSQSWCASPRNCTERVICQTPQLARLDQRMSDLYFTLQDQLNRRGARELLRSQRAWLASRDSCSCNANCLVGHYNARIQLFEEVMR